jgi:hypothetical protein
VRFLEQGSTFFGQVEEGKFLQLLAIIAANRGQIRGGNINGAGAIGLHMLLLQIRVAELSKLASREQAYPYCLMTILSLSMPTGFDSNA